MAIMLAFQAFTIGCATVAFAVTLRFIARYLEIRRQRPDFSSLNTVLERLDRIEATVDATAIEAERISEANRFMSKLLAERTGAASVPNRPERVITPH